MRPSAVGPTDEKPARSPVGVTAPTVITESPSAGAVMNIQSEVPSLPALATTTTPSDAARSAARVNGVVSPSRSA